MKVRLLNVITEEDMTAEDMQNEMKIAGWMASVSYDSKAAKEKIARHCIGARHGTPTRPMRFLFEISEVSRVFSHEFVRHEIGLGKVQRSQRYVKEDGFGYVTPKSLENITVPVEIFYDFNNGFSHTYQMPYSELQEVVRQWYTGAVEQGVKAEDARYALTNATHTKIHVSFDWEGLMQFCYRRCCTRAQWEIRDVAFEIKRLVTELSPFLGDKLGAHCHQHGYCPELPKGCGKAPSFARLMELVEKGHMYEGLDK